MKTRTWSALAAACLSAASADAVPVTSGLIQDLDAEVGVTRSGNDVTAWANQGSAGDDVSTNKGTPQFVSNATPNGQSAISFFQQRMAGGDHNAFTSLLSGTGYTWFVVMDPDAQDGGSNNIFGALNNNPGTGFINFNGFAVGLDANSALRMLERDLPTNEITLGQTAGLDNLGWVIAAGRLAAGTGAVAQEVFLNSATADGTSSVNISGSPGIYQLTSALTLGAERSNGRESFDGDVARILIYDRELTDAELEQVGYSLSQTYGIPTTFVPEPTSLALLGLGGLIALRRRR